MPYNVFLIPIITGYLILVFSLLFKYNIQRLSRGRILFEAVAQGLLIVIIGFALRTLLKILFPNFIPTLLAYLEIIPITKPRYFWTIVFASFLAIFFIFISNQLIRRRFGRHLPIVWAIRQNGDEIEKLFKDSAVHGFPMLITLKNDKVYVGFSEQIPIPQKTNYLTISPIFSGYRDPKTKKLEITTDYINVVEEFIKEIEDKEGVELDEIQLNTDIIIKQDEILTAGPYDHKVYEKFNKKTNAKIGF